MPVSISGTNGVTFPDSSLQAAAASPYVLKNRIINGAMQVWQRGTSFTSTNGYTADRWSTAGFTGVNASQSTSVPTITTGNSFQYSLKVGRPAASTATTTQLIAQCIESNNCYDLSGQTVTFSFWAKAGANYSSASNSLGLAIYTGTAADQGLNSYVSWTGAATPLATTTTINTTWTRYSYTVTFGANVLESAIFFYYTPSGTAGADDNFYITGVQLEIGSTATPFERRLYNQELANCQRYYQTSYVAGTAIDSTTGVTDGVSFISINTSDSTNGGLYPITMRASPTVSVYSTTGGSGSPSARNNSTGAAITSITLNGGTSTNLPRLTKAAGLPATGSSCSAQFTASAEL